MSAPPNTAAPCSGRLQPAAGAVCADKVANNLEWCSAAVLQTAHTNHHCMGSGEGGNIIENDGYDQNVYYCIHPTSMKIETEWNPDDNYLCSLFQM